MFYFSFEEHQFIRSQNDFVVCTSQKATKQHQFIVSPIPTHAHAVASYTWQ